MDDTAHAHIAPRRRFAALLSFTRSQSAGGLALIIAASVALAWSPSPACALYFRLLNLPISAAWRSVGK